MRITFDLEPADLEHFEAALARCRHAVRTADEADVVEAAKFTLDRLCAGALPGYIRERLAAVQRLILMLEDEDWALPDPERSGVIETLVYFSDPDDLIEDSVEVIGLLDDAIMLELLLQRQRRVLAAWERFRAFRSGLVAGAGSGGRTEYARKLVRRRRDLHRSMRRPAARG
jgi:uncharacterized membrane protein YkvA (DUF1232 family)